MRVVILLLVTLLALGCAARVAVPEAADDPRAEPVRDLALFPQNPLAYLDVPGKAGALIAPARHEERFAEFRERFFAPWTRERPAHGAAEALWGFSAHAGRNVWGQDLRRRPPEWIQNLAATALTTDYPNLGRPAVALTRLDMRVLPTVAPIFRDPELPGQGFPFDLNQNSAAHAGTPLFASHVTADGWVLVETSFAAGFVPARDIAFVDQAFMDAWRALPLAALLREGEPLRVDDGRVAGVSRIGMVLPLAQGEDGPRLLLPVAEPSGMAALLRIEPAPGLAEPLPRPLTPLHTAAVAAELTGAPYGWGGLYGERDCSSLVQDIFASFGLWLPRNSRQQAAFGRSISLAGLSDEEKTALIREHGKPFQTILAMPGHVVLYLGQWRGQAAVLHAVWGLRTGEGERRGRLVIGRTVITDLAPGSEHPDLSREDGRLVSRLTAMTFVE